MKKMMDGSFVCEISVAADYSLLTAVPCEYGKDTVAYAVERFFPKSKRFCRECTQRSWETRIAKGRKDKKQDFAYVIPAILMELPGNWIRVSGEIDAVGVRVRKVEILNEHPVFVKSLAAAAQTPYNKNKKRR